jgi:hypothetical protein
LELQLISSFNSHLRGTQTKRVPPYQAENRSCCTVPDGHQQILAKSWYSRAHRILSYLCHPKTGNRECVIILRDHAINGTKEATHAFNT